MHGQLNTQKTVPRLFLLYFSFLSFFLHTSLHTLRRLLTEMHEMESNCTRSQNDAHSSPVVRFSQRCSVAIFNFCRTLGLHTVGLSANKSATNRRTDTTN